MLRAMLMRAVNYLLFDVSAHAMLLHKMPCRYMLTPLYYIVYAFVDVAIIR